MIRRLSPRPQWRVRILGSTLGALITVGLVVVTAAPLTSVGASPKIAVRSDRGHVAAATYEWPSVGEAAVGVPALGFAESSPRERVQPIASLTKMMTAYVALQLLPLASGETGPCHVVSKYDVATYIHDQETDQSSVPVTLGVQLCESTLIEGIFVHSAGNYAQMLVAMTGETTAQFVALMNHTAVALGMTRTHYVDVTGISTGSESNAHDQLIMVEHVMMSPVVRDVARKTSATLPGAGVVTTYTPLLGTNDVVGVKSGFTSQAGGCDALALRSVRGGMTYLSFAIVLGQTTGDVLLSAGTIAYDLAHLAATQVQVAHLDGSVVVNTIGFRGSGTATLLASFANDDPSSIGGLALTLAPFVTSSDTDTTGSPPLAASGDLGPAPFSGVPAYWKTIVQTKSLLPGQSVVGDIQFAGDATVYQVLATSVSGGVSVWNDLL